MRPVARLLLLLSLLGADLRADAAGPASPRALPTTAGAIYLGNLDQRIGVLEALQQQSPGPAGAAMLAGALYHRYRVRGDLTDAERAMALADAAVAVADAPAEHFALRAAIRSGFHRFAEAGADLDIAQARGLPAQTLRAARQELALATGRYGDLRAALVAPAASVEPDFDALALRAHLRELQGDRAGAARDYRQAEAAYADTNPVPLAWLYVQQGIAWLEADDPRRARPYFAAAHARLPGYTLATEHLAETEALLGHSDRARALYHAAIAASGDPAFIDALARLERDAGHAALATQLAAQARSGWEARLAQHPQAFAGHAIEYFLEQGEIERALALARDTTRVRRDVSSLVLLARAAEAAGRRDEACGAWHEAHATGLAPPRLRALSGYEDRCRHAH